MLQCGEISYKCARMAVAPMTPGEDVKIQSNKMDLQSRKPDA